MPSLIEKLIDCGAASRDVTELRSQALDLLQRHVGFDCASYVDMREDAVFEEKTVLGISQGVFNQLRPAWNSMLVELADVVAEMQRDGVASISLRYPMARRERLTMYRLGHGPLGMVSDLQCLLPVRRDTPVILSLGRQGRPHYRVRDVELVKQVHRTLSVAEAAVRYRLLRATARMNLEALEPRERELVELLAQGTDAELAGHEDADVAAARDRLVLGLIAAKATEKGIP